MNSLLVCIFKYLTYVLVSRAYNSYLKKNIRTYLLRLINPIAIGIRD